MNALKLSIYLAALLPALPAAGQTFEDLTRLSGVQNPGLFSTNLAWADFDEDGDLDLYVTNWATAISVPANALFANQGDGTFVDVAPALGLDNKNNSIAAAWADFDEDGDLDLYVADFFEQDFLYASEAGVFVEVGRSRQSINLERRGSVTSMAWGDYDNDGWLDFYLGKFYFDNELYHNNGDGTFTPVLDLVVGDRRDTNGFSWVDYDNDGDLDLYVVNREQENALFRNDMDQGVFTSIACALSIGNKEIGQNGVWADYDNDGDLDLYTANVGGNALFRNDGEARFVDVARQAGVRLSGAGWISASAAFADYDGDGDLDLYVVNGGDEQRQPDALFANDGDGTFTNATAAARLPTGVSAHLAAGWGDFTGEGAPDLYLTNGFGEGNQLFRNGAPGGRFITVRVQGKGAQKGGANPDGIGTRVRLFEAASGRLVGFRQLLSGPGEPLAVFGAAAGPYIVEVLFPGGSTPLRVANISPGARIRVVEP